MNIQQPRTRTEHGFGRLRAAGAALVVVLAAIAVLDASLPATASGASSEAGPSMSVASVRAAPRLPELASRVDEVESGWAELSAYYDAQVAPVERVLLRYRGDTALVRRIAVALVREARNIGVEPGILLAVLLVENPWLEPTIRSPVGAVGLMQVMPFHEGSWPECGADLEDIDSNICHGARIFEMYWHRSDGDLDRTLLRYNGCVSGSNTPNCHQYPKQVLAYAGRASLSWMSGSPGAGSP